ncbi:MAG: hypothetical protein M1136_06530 [Chloroflexi bacterium]|nr:hypothetical protein [Chloroflexota bacterium]MCL5075287.1 hypothetical protein [Chloroflexota bacterium]
MLFLFVAALIPRALDLDKTLLFGASVWVERAQQFWAALGRLDFEGTFITGHPGVINMFLYRSYRLVADQYPQTLAPQVILLALLVPCVYWLMKEVTDDTVVGLAAGVFIAFDPFLIAFARSTLLDGLMGMMGGSR